MLATNLEFYFASGSEESFWQGIHKKKEFTLSQQQHLKKTVLNFPISVTFKFLSKLCKYRRKRY